MTVEPLTLVTGSDTPLFLLDRKGRFRLSADGHQWIIQRWEHNAWRGQKFLVDRPGLYRAMEELKCRPTPQAREIIDGWPNYFKGWLVRALRGGTSGPIDARVVCETPRPGADLPASRNDSLSEAA